MSILQENGSEVFQHAVIDAVNYLVIHRSLKVVRKVFPRRYMKKLNELDTTGKI